MFPYQQDNIVALATPPGISALAVIRFSGSDLTPLYTKLTHIKRPKDRLAVFTKIYHPVTQHLLDESVVTFFAGPNSYTGEDVFEISCHGGESVPNNIIHAALYSGARNAEPGEFSFRAFMNGKIDLVQAEAISSLISSKSTLSSEISLKHLEGKISSLINNLKNRILNLLTTIENELNFSEEEIDFTHFNTIKEKVEDVRNNILDIIETTTFGKKVVDGVRVVIYGKPNSGKSSLYNTILGYDRAIVSSHAGTTRDTIEAWIELEGIPVCLIDTAGVWESEDYLENLGIEKTNSELGQADLCILVDEVDPSFLLKVDNSQVINKNHILVKTKADIANGGSVDNNGFISTSAKNNTGIKKLLTSISTYIIENINCPDRIDKVVISKRQRVFLEKSLDCLDGSLRLISSHGETDIIASQLREFIHIIDEIVGKVSNEEIIRNIFQNFCVGK